MLPNATETVLGSAREREDCDKLVAPQAAPRKHELAAVPVTLFTYWHISGLYGLYLICTVATWQTIVFTLLMYNAGILGITAGAHRLWSHKTYKATKPLEILLMIFHSFTSQNTVRHWARDHRFHHKYSDTDADPHNATRGFFYSHVGWLLVKKHPEVLKRSRTIDMSDIYNNPVLRFQKIYGAQVILSCAYILPSLTPMLWGQSFSDSWHINSLRIILNLHASCLVNSAAHAFGNKPYDKNIAAAQISTLSFVTLGECFHNYHHVFPWDYRTAELGNNRLNLTTIFIDFFAWIGWAYDLKTATDEMIESRAKRTGDGTNLWGWGDKDLVKSGEKVEKIYYGWGDKDMKDTSGVKVLYTQG
ncbi:acyl-CoA Delta(11) desaturase-like [Choristoneura fumiferana]|uniref:acyl-CoA Delta(11) desaturase-like n=1 Tax=Choristoneura fumiferana TaxID=7141 RepID=UPI003D154160